MPRLGAAIAFYSLLSLAPLLLISASIMDFLFGHSASEHGIVEEVRNLVGPTAAKAVIAFFKGSHDTSTGILSTIAGLITLLFGASGVLVELRGALNTIWEVPTPQSSGFRIITSFVKERLFSFAMVLGFGFLLIVSLVLSAWISALEVLSTSVPTGEAVLLHIVNFVISFVVVAAIFAAIYKIVPDIEIDWREATIGGAITSILFTLGKVALGIYLGRASYASTYGAAASVVILIAWVYYSAQIFFLGAEFTKAFAQTHGSHSASALRNSPKQA